ncbi:hypothetical protein BDZ89DRAFT_636989 [Hymenopellis radicata]|nr:hypothetical protein BDZ89DRAFT_636989 [Hymenopellis radicata]
MFDLAFVALIPRESVAEGRPLCDFDTHTPPRRLQNHLAKSPELPVWPCRHITSARDIINAFRTSPFIGSPCAPTSSGVVLTTA